VKVEFEVKAFGREEAKNAIDAFRSTEVARTYQLPEETTLAELEQLINELYIEVEQEIADPEQCLGKITIRLKKEDGSIKYLG